MDIEAWINAIDEQTKRAELLVSKITTEQLNTSPAPKKWSIGELLDHIVTSNKLYFETFDTIGNGNHTNPGMLGLKFIPKALGKMVVNSITPETKRKSKTASIFVPATSTHELSYIEEFKECQENLKERVIKMKEMETEKIWIRSPVTGMIIYTLEDALRLLLNHEKRHLGQAEAILNKFEE